MRLLEGRQTPRADEIPDEWIDDFFSKAQSISDDGLQRVWSQVLAGKALEPRRYTKRLLHALFLMEASDAELFQRLTRYCCRRVDLQEHAVQPIVFTRLPEGMGSGSAFTDAELGALERLGLVEIDYGAGYFIEGEPVFQYGDTRITFLARPDGSAHPVGSVRLTREGLDLHGVCQLAAGNVVNIDRIIGFMRHLGTSVVVSKPTGERVYESVAASGID